MSVGKKQSFSVMCALCDFKIVRKLLGWLINFPTRDDGTIVLPTTKKSVYSSYPEQKRQKHASPFSTFVQHGKLGIWDFKPTA